MPADLESRMLIRCLSLLLAFGLALPTHAANEWSGNGGFCLYPLPEDGGKRRYINLHIVQYVEVDKDELKIVYGGGALGAGYDIKLALKTPDEGKALLDELSRVARNCAAK